MATKIKLPNKRTGVLLGIEFKNGVGSTDNVLGPNLRNYFNSIGATLTESDGKPEQTDEQKAAAQAEADAAAAKQKADEEQATADADAKAAAEADASANTADSAPAEQPKA